MRSAVVRTLGKIGRPTKEVVLFLIEEFRNQQKTLRREAAIALKEVGDSAIPYLIDALEDGQTEVCFYAAMALGGVGPLASEAVPYLIQVLKDQDVRAIAAWALGQIGPNAEDAVPDLIEALGDSKFIIRNVSAEALGRIGPNAKLRFRVCRYIIGGNKGEKSSNHRGLWGLLS